MLSILTQDTSETASLTVESRTPSGMQTPPYQLNYHPLASPRDRPKTPTGKKSPFKSNADDESVRKSRIKTEMCMHYRSGRPCPFGANCTYAHGEEELQMTKLMDLHKAGLVDKDTYRIKPCLTWVATGSWYVHKLSRC